MSSPTPGTLAVLALINLAGAILSYSFLAYAVARWLWRGRGMGLIALALFIAGEVWMIPQMIGTIGFGWSGTLYSLWFGNWLGSLFAIMVCAFFLANSSGEMADAARLDGCGAFGIWWHVVLPLVRPALLLSAVFILMATWSVFLAPFVPLRSPVMAQLESIPPIEINLILFAGSFLLMLPVIVIFFFAQRHFVRPTGAKSIAE